MSDFDFACACDVTSWPFYERCHTAKKQHACMDCGGEILPGQWYMAVGGMCEGEWWNGKVCCACWSALEWVKAHIPCVCVSFGNMREELTEICRTASHQAPGLLFGYYRRVLGGKVMAKPTKEETRATT